MLMEYFRFPHRLQLICLKEWFATVEILKAELCTPTGAAILKYYVNEFGNMPAMIMEKQGYGMGNKDFPVANCIRAILGEKTENNSIRESNNDTNQNNRTLRIVILSKTPLWSFVAILTI